MPRGTGQASGQLHQVVYVVRHNQKVVYATSNHFELGIFITKTFEKRSLEVTKEPCGCDINLKREKHKESCVINQAPEKLEKRELDHFLHQIVLFYPKELKEQIRQDKKFWPKFNKSFPDSPPRLSEWEGIDV